MKQFISHIGKAIGGISALGGAFSQVAAGLMMLLITVDVIGRQFFGRPTYVADELSGYFLVAITFLALGQTEKLRRHLKVDIIFSWLSKKKGAWLTLICSIISLGFIVWFTWSTAVSAKQSFDIGTHKQTGLGTPYWIPELLLPVGLGIFALQLIVSITQQAKALR